VIKIDKDKLKEINKEIREECKETVILRSKQIVFIKN